jgi:hypothetical protein
MQVLKGKSMSAHCCDHDAPKLDAIANLARYRKIL